MLVGREFSGGFAIWLNGNPSTSYVIEWSPDLVNWQLLETGYTDAEGSVLVIDEQYQGNATRYYRAQ